MGDRDSSPAPSGEDDSFAISESLVPVRESKGAGESNVSFDDLLSEPLLLKEDISEGCGGRLWPAGMVLAKYLLRQRRPDFSDKTIVELGAGGGLVGLAVARGCILSSPVYLTDQKPMLSLMETNIKLNNLQSLATATVLDWGEPLPETIPSHPDVILAADCVYFEPAFPLLISTLRELIGPHAVCYFCFKRRRRADLRFMKLARKMFDVREIQDDPDAASYKQENIFLYSIRARIGNTDDK